MWVPQLLEWGLFMTLLPACGSCSPNWAALSGLSGRGSAWSCSAKMGWYRGGVQGVREDGRGAMQVRGDWEERDGYE